VQFIIQHVENGKTKYLEARVPGVCCAWGSKREWARRYPEPEARDLAAAMTPFFAEVQAVQA
jgi:hypothetical protein